MDTAPTTAYLMTHKQGKCAANCGFCPQARGSQSKSELLSRVAWPAFSSSAVIAQIKRAANLGKIGRVCIQALNYPEVFDEVCTFVRALKLETSVPVSVSCQPIDVKNLWSLAKAGVDRVGIPLDAATEEIFDQVKGAKAGGPYSWQREFILLRAAMGVFGEGNVSTHLIAGLGETEKEACLLLQQCVDMGVLPALFAFTPVRGTTLQHRPKPPLQSYRRLQLAQYLLVHSLARVEDMAFSVQGVITCFGADLCPLVELVESGLPFLTSGCIDCNRPYYNENASGPFYNFPKMPLAVEIAEIKRQLELEEA